MHQTIRECIKFGVNEADIVDIGETSLSDDLRLDQAPVADHWGFPCRHGGTPIDGGFIHGTSYSNG